MTDKTTIEKRKATGLVKARPHPEALNARIESLRGSGKLADLDAQEDVLDDMVDRILSAEDEDELLGGTIPIAQLTDQVIRIEEVNFRPSSVRPHDYAIMRFVAQDGRRGVTTNGGPRLVATLVRAAELDKLPLTARVAARPVEYAPDQWGTTYFLVAPR